MAKKARQRVSYGKRLRDYLFAANLCAPVALPPPCSMFQPRTQLSVPATVAMSRA